MSVITTTDTTFFDPFEQLLHDLTERIDAVATAIATESRQLDRHEEFTTSRLAQAINDALHHHPITAPGLALEVHAEEFTKPAEKVAGADLYISLVRKDVEFPRSKGLLVQAKRRSSMLRSDEPRRLGNQCKRMNRRSKTGSYVWVYDAHGIVSAKAPQSSEPILQRLTDASSVGELIADGLRCNKGDDNIGRELSAEPTAGIKAVMRRLSVPQGLDFVVRQD
ncbi:hypothetical protein GPL17_33110 [Bradyrhizobium yuanmingense]|uniref:hypothetical protein n=1 Tax=Bradyrhizobium yuanmingense TaxID=108015 RepID=UPI0012FAC192|nr:hypothetical protein [Bradyrhizobium yuanmingense]MVT55274.1 hypothetical protein [Bradyrhizobium yuanmingense]